MNSETPTEICESPSTALENTASPSDHDSPDLAPQTRTPKELLIASKEYAQETRWLSWWHLWSTLAVMGGMFAISVSGLPIALRIVTSVLTGLLIVRMFIIYHDFQHNAILQNSLVARIVMNLYGLLVLAPESVWRDSHNDHHKTNSQVWQEENVGSFPIMTTDDYANATAGERLAYTVSRHPITIAIGYITVFLWRMCLLDFLKSPRQHFDGGIAVLLHIGLLVLLASFGWDVMLLGLVVPLFVGSGMGSYLFYAQHNFPGAKMCSPSQWSHVDAALVSSSYMPMNPVMHWFTGNIGYHHVHHLNAKIPFYRLPEAMNGIEELQSPPTTTLYPSDIIACLRLKLWSEEEGRFVSFKGV